jgi:thiopeptide-type bacteriocin biosynthesis protein
LLYRAIDAAMVRVATQPSTLDTLPWPDLTANDEQIPRWQAWLEKVWTHATLASAIEEANPALAQQIQRIRTGHEQQAPRVRSAVLSVIRYVQRAKYRSTPFGLFVGVAPARIADQLTVRLGDHHRAVARVDTAWLSTVIMMLEQHDPLLDRLPVMLTNLCSIRDDRLVVGLRRHPTSRNADPAEVFVCRTPAIDVVLRAACSPIVFAELARTLADEFPTVPQATITATLEQLLAQRILLSSLQPPMTATDPLGHVVDELAARDAERVDEVASLARTLRETHTLLTQHNQTDAAADAARIRSAVVQTMADLTFATTQTNPGNQDLKCGNRGQPTRHEAPRTPLHVDLRADLTLDLPPVVMTEASRAASALARLTALPAGSPHWLDYCARFQERYGVGAAVPLLELIDPDVGLGFPAGYRGSLLELPERALTSRDAQLLAIAQHAALAHQQEVELDDAALDDLAAAGLATARWRPSAELMFRLHAPNTDALARGEFDLVPHGFYRAAGSVTGRFLDVLEPDDRDRMIRAYRTMPSGHVDAIRAQVSSPALYADPENVTRSLAVLPRLVPINEHRPPSDHLLYLDDLLVVEGQGQLHLVSRSHGRAVDIASFNIVEIINSAHPLQRFLTEIGAAFTPPTADVDWGAADRLPYLPRLRYSRTILSPARWRLTRSELPPPRSTTAASRPVAWSTWRTAFTEWRERVGAPTVVDLGATDMRLRLDLREDAHLLLLAAHLADNDTVVLTEAPPDTAFGWLDGHAHELVVPVTLTKQHTPAPARFRMPATVTERHHPHLPGGECVFAKLYGHPDRHTAILTKIHDLFPCLPGTDAARVDWWFLPYRDPGNHLRLRFRLPYPDLVGPAIRDLGTWAADLRARGLTGRLQLDTYTPEFGRFGPGPALAAAEDYFAADSAAALTQRVTVAAKSDDQHVLTAASLTHLALSFLGLDEGVRFLLDHIPKAPRGLDRDLRTRALKLADPRDGWSALRTHPGGETITAAWTHRAATLTAYRAALTATGGPDPHDVLPALLHLHSLRIAGIDRHTEQLTLHLARAAALSHAARTKTP